MPSLGPYRTPDVSTADDEAQEPAVGTPLIPVMLAGFAAATSRVVLAVMEREDFSAEPTLALLSAVALALAVSTRARRYLRAQREKPAL